jgi:glycosyltransferase involved in cell wall biosynthesis
VSSKAEISQSQNEWAPAPALSVLMGVHNGLPYLPEAVESILGQTFTDFEFIIIDDGSTDGSGAWLEERAKSEPRIRFFRQEKSGLAKTLNRGLGLARGEFIARMDSDDIALPHRLEIQSKTLREKSDLLLLGSEVDFIDENGRQFFIRGHACDHAEIRRRLLTGDGGALTHPTVMFRAFAAKQIGGYDEWMTTSQDVDFFLRLSEIGKVANLPEVLLLWRHHAGSTTFNRSDTWALMRKHCVGKTIRRIGLDRYLEELFPPMKLGYPEAGLERGRWAIRQARYREAATLYRQALRTPGQRLPAAQGLCEAALLEVNARLWSGLKRFWSRLKLILSPR